MKLFQAKTEVITYKKAEQFIKEFEIGADDFIVASQSTYDTYFKPAGLAAHVVYKRQYGSGEPTITMINKMLADFRKTGCQRIIAIGGGAVIDMAKILVLDGAYQAEDYFHHKVPLKKIRDLIAIPTTCGAGSEVTNISIAEFEELQSKLGLAVDPLYPDQAVLIPELLEGLPYSVFASSSIDALIHAVESFLSPKATEYSKALSLLSANKILDGFLQLKEKGKESRKEIIGDFLMASNMAGIAFGNAGTGTVHAMSYPLSGSYHVTHGEANYQFFVEVLRVYQEKCAGGAMGELFAAFAVKLGCPQDEVMEQLSGLLDDVLIRNSLRSYGMKETEIESFTDNIIKSQQRLLTNSYVPLSRDELAGIYRRLY